MAKLLTLLLAVFLFIPGFALSQSGKISKYELNYQNRIKKTHLFGVYIPKDIDDAFKQLDDLIGMAGKQKFKDMNEKEAANKLFYSFGRWMIYNWGFYEGSRLSHYLNGLGIYDPDDLAMFLMRSYHRYLNSEPLETENLIFELNFKE